MKPQPLRNLRRRMPWLALLALLAFGCSRLPTAPELAARDVAAPAETDLLQERIEPLDPVLSSDGSLLPPVIEPDTLVRVEDIDGALGGEVKVGTVEVLVPRGAFEGEAEITITIPDDDKLMCHLDIYPASKNQFEVPVTLSFDVSHVEDTHNLGVFWFNEERGVWMQIAADLDPDGRRISASLSHFSKYKVGKASWKKASW